MSRWLIGVVGVLVVGFAAFGQEPVRRRPGRPAEPKAHPPKTVKQEIESRLAAVGREVERLGKAGDERGAKELADNLAYFRGRLEGKAMAAGEADLHLIGAYEGAAGGGGQGGFEKKPHGSAAVEVDSPDRPVVLALCAYEPVRWELKVAAGTKISKLILAGYHEQQAAGVPEGVIVEKQVQEGGGGAGYFYAYRKESDQYASAAAQLKKLTGLEVATFQGIYKYRGEPFVVGAKNPEWRLQRVLAELEPVYRQASAVERARERDALQHLRFQAVLFSPGANHPLQVTASLAQFTPTGPIDGTAKPLPQRVTRVAVDAKGEAWYAIQGHDVLRIDPKTGDSAKAVVAGPGVPEVSWPCALAFDGKRRRLVLASMGGEGFLYAYSPDTDKWSLLASLNNIDLQALAYSADEDCYYGLGVGRDEGAGAPLYRFDADGNAGDVVALSERLPGGRMAIHSVPPQLVAVGKQLAVVTCAQPDRGDVAAGEGRCLLVDPKTGQVEFSAVVTPHAGEVRELGEQELLRLWEGLGDADAEAAGRCEWLLAAGGGRAVAFLRPKFAAAEKPDAAWLRGLLARLEEGEFAAREKAFEDLERVAPQIGGELEQLLKGELAPETRTRVEAALRRLAEATPEQLIEKTADANLRRELRAVRVLERIGSAEAAACLKELAAGPEHAARTKRAREAVGGR